MIASIIIWFLGYYPNHDAYETVAEQQENSYIGQLGRAIEPVIKPMGFDWKLGIGLISGVGAKELVVSTLGVYMWMIRRLMRLVWLNGFR